jgi:flavodoxin
VKALVVYYTRTGNTRFVAERVAREIGAAIEEVTDGRDRRGPIGFLRSGYESTRGILPKIEETKEDPRDYDLVVIGTPVWNARPSTPIRAYLNGHDLSGKQTAIFCANARSGGDVAIERTRALIPKSNDAARLVATDAIRKGASSEAKISQWCSNLKSF